LRLSVYTPCSATVGEDFRGTAKNNCADNSATPVEIRLSPDMPCVIFVSAQSREIAAIESGNGLFPAEFSCFIF
jgi:hypothetical protein